MLIVMEHSATQAHIATVIDAVKRLGLTPQPIPGENRVAIGVLGNQGYVDEEPFRDLPSIQELIHVTKPYKLVSRDFHPSDSVVTVGGAKVGWGLEPVVIAGPCTVESREQVFATARAVKAAGARILRGGALSVFIIHSIWKTSAAGLAYEHGANAGSADGCYLYST